MGARSHPWSVTLLRCLGVLALATIPLSVYLGRTRTEGCPPPITGPCDPFSSTPSWTGYAIAAGAVAGLLLLLAASHIAEVWREEESPTAVRRALVLMFLWAGAVSMLTLPVWRWLARERTVGCGRHLRTPCDPATVISASALIGFALALLLGCALLVSAGLLWIRGRSRARQTRAAAAS